MSGYKDQMSVSKKLKSIDRLLMSIDEHHMTSYNRLKLIDKELLSGYKELLSGYMKLKAIDRTLKPSAQLFKKRSATAFENGTCHKDFSS